MAKVIRLSEVWAMLETCAPGHTHDTTDHHHEVTYKKKKYYTLPLGKHGARKNPEIEAGHVRQLARQLEISDCAKEQLPNIYS